MNFPSMINSEVLQVARGMSVAMLGTLLALGLAIWLFGWKWHRFWITCLALATAVAITWKYGNLWTQTPLAVVITVIALAAAVVAVELARLAIFVLGGVTLYHLTCQYLPEFHDTWLAFPLGGLIAMLLYRLGWLIVTSILGTLIMVHAGLLLLESVATFDSMQWSQDNTLIIHIGICVWTILGIVCQLWMNCRFDKHEDNPSHENTHIPVLIPVQNHQTNFSWRKWFSRQQPML